MTYLGSKVKYSKYIVPIIQDYIDNSNTKVFIDCCCGGCNIIKEIKADTRIGIDNNKYLIALLNKIKDPNFKFPPKPSRENWDKCKEFNTEMEDWYIGLTSIFSSYNTRGFAGGFIHGEIGEKQYNGRCNTFKKDFELIKNVTFICDNYNSLLNYNNCCIYVDPPYKNTKKYDSSKNFNYEDFWNTMRSVGQNNKIFISEMDVPDDFKIIWELDTSRNLGGKITYCTEKLVTI